MGCIRLQSLLYLPYKVFWGVLRLPQSPSTVLLGRCVHELLHQESLQQSSLKRKYLPSYYYLLAALTKWQGKTHSLKDNENKISISINHFQSCNPPSIYQKHFEFQQEGYWHSSSFQRLSYWNLKIHQRCTPCKLLEGLLPVRHNYFCI